MSITARTVRLLMPVAALLFLSLALLIRVVDDGALRQYSGTALYASMVWAGVLFLWPRVRSAACRSRRRVRQSDGDRCRRRR